MSDSKAHRLISAALESPEILLALIGSEPALMNERTGLGETPLHFLVVENQLGAVKILVEHGFDVNTLNSCGGTPLSEAASLGYSDLVAYLLAAGARIDIPGQDEPVLHNAVRSGNCDVVSRLIAAGANVNALNDLRETALHLAAESDDRFPALERLLDAGADPTVRRIFDETALDVALKSGSQKCFASLLARQVQAS